MFTFGFSLMVIVVNSCKTKVVDTKKSTKEAHFERIFNPDSTLVLELSFKKNLDLVKDYRFKVYDAATKELIFSDTFRGTKLIWHTNNSLKGYLYVGVVQQEDENPLKQNSNQESSFTIIQIKK